MFNFIEDSIQVPTQSTAINMTVPRWYFLIDSEHWVLAGSGE